MSVSTLKQIFDQKTGETETTTTTNVTNSPTKSKLSVFNVPLSSALVQQSIANNNASRLKNNINNNNQQQRQQKTIESNSFDKGNKTVSFAQKTIHNEDNSVSHHHQPSSPRNKMVAKQEIDLEPDVPHENDEDFKYGPGFVSKLRYRYLSLTLRQTSVSKQRPSILELRRSTSLNNLLDGEEEEEDEEEEECEDLEREENYEDVSEKRRASETNGNNNNRVQHENQKNHTRNGIDKHKIATEHYAPTEQHHHHHHSIRNSRSIDKNLNLKRARSVEAILRFDHSSWDKDVQKEEAIQYNEPIIKASQDITIEDKIHNARERSYNAPPKRLASLIDDDERPPPGICKTTMRIFEASANKKRNLQTRPIAQEIANKMAIFKCQNEKPAITAKKPNILPRTSSPKPTTLNHHPHVNQVNNNNMNNSEKFAKYSKEKTVLPKLDINIIKNNLETKTNGSGGNSASWSPAENKDSYRIKHDYSPAHSDSSLSSTPNIMSPYRNSMSPQLNEHLSPKKTVVDSSSSPIISSLTSKLSNLHMESTSTPKLSASALQNHNNIMNSNNKSNNNLLKSIDDDSENDVNSDKEASDKSFNTNNGDAKGIGSGVIGGGSNVSEVKSADSLKTPNLTQKINNNFTKITTIAPPQPPLMTTTTTTAAMPKVNHEKSVIVGGELNNGSEVKSVKENSVITKPTTKPPPPPTSTSAAAVKVQQSRDNDSNTKSSLMTSNDNASDSSSTPKWTFGKKKSSWSSQSTDEPTNSIVFNFSDRKDVPDYIDNDGLILRRKRELPKPNESGFVLLGDLTLDSSSTDLDDAYHMGPPSPCDVEFENANIIPEGKSSIRTRTKEVKFKIQFDDSLTATFEYPSETSLLIDETFGDEDEVDVSFYGRSGSSSKLLTSVPLGSTPFANYQPQKANSCSFELGITRTTPSPSSASSEENTFISNPDEDDSDYLKPATDEESHRWSSEETRGTDLLF